MTRRTFDTAIGSAPSPRQRRRRIAWREAWMIVLAVVLTAAAVNLHAQGVRFEQEIVQ